jgi:hypothetical protein
MKDLRPRVAYCPVCGALCGQLHGLCRLCVMHPLRAARARDAALPPPPSWPPSAEDRARGLAWRRVIRLTMQATLFALVVAGSLRLTFWILSLAP